KTELPGLQDNHQTIVRNALDNGVLSSPKFKGQPLTGRGIVNLAIRVQKIGWGLTTLVDFLQEVLCLLLAALDHFSNAPILYSRLVRLPWRTPRHCHLCRSSAAPLRFPVRLERSVPIWRHRGGNAEPQNRIILPVSVTGAAGRLSAVRLSPLGY